MINFKTISPNVRASNVFIELFGKKKTVSGDVLPPIGLIIGQYDPLKTSVVEDVPIKVTTSDEVADKTGFGFELHRQSLWIFGMLGGFYDNMYIVPVAPPSAGGKATGTITFATNASSSGTYYFSIGGDVIQVNVASGDTPTEVGDALVAAIGANLNSMVTAVNVTGTVTLTAKDEGVNGNQIKLVQSPSGESQSSEAPTGMTVTLPGSGGYLTGGTGNTDIHDVFFNSDESEKLGDRFYTCISCPYTDATNLGYLKDAWAARKAAGVQRPFDSFVGYVKDVYADALAKPATINSEGITPMWDPRSYSPNWELQASVMGIVMASTAIDPGRPFKTLKTGIPINPDTGDLSYALNDALFRAGMSYFKTVAGDLVIGDLALSYRTNSVGAETEEWYDSVSMHRRQQITYDVESLFKAEPYTRAILAGNDSTSTKDYVIKPKKVITDLSNLVDNWNLQGWVKNVAAIKASIVAEINESNNSRLDTSMQIDEAFALRIVANLINFIY